MFFAVIVLLVVAFIVNTAGGGPSTDAEAQSVKIASASGLDQKTLNAAVTASATSSVPWQVLAALISAETPGYQSTAAASTSTRMARTGSPLPALVVRIVSSSGVGQVQAVGSPR